MLFRYNKLPDEDSYRIVGFEVNPQSVAFSEIPENDGELCKADLGKVAQQAITADTKEIKFSYDVDWEVG